MPQISQVIDNCLFLRGKAVIQAGPFQTRITEISVCDSGSQCTCSTQEVSSEPEVNFNKYDKTRTDYWDNQARTPFGFGEES